MTAKLLGEAQFHGANRLADKESRYWWIPANLLLLGTATTVAYLTIIRYLESPTYNVQVETLHLFTEFPSVLICPEISYSQENINQFISEVKFPPGLNASYIREVLPQMAAFYSLDVPYKIKDLQNIEHLLEYNRLDVEKVGQKLTMTCEEALIKCRWDNKMKKCSDIFQMELTADGFCCVFNGRSLKRELKEHGTSLETRSKWYTKQFGFSSGLMLAVNQSQKPFSVDLTYKWVALQTSRHFVDTTVNGTALNPGSEQWVAYQTRSYHITKAAQELSINLRKCRMPYERLKYFPLYNRRYCLLECEIAKTLERCECVRAVHLRPPGARRCRSNSLLCAKHAVVSVGDPSCECPRTCEVETDYLHISNFKLIENKHSPLDTFYEDLDFNKVTVVRAFIQRRLKKTLERWSYYGYIDIFAQLGGVVNVFFGCSVLSVFGILHLICRILLKWVY